MSRPRATQVSEADFYVSGGFWLTVALVLIGLLGLAIAYLAYQVSRSKRVIEWTARVVAIVRDDPEVLQHLKLEWDGRGLADPTILAVTVSNAGRLDIGTAAYDGGRPMVLHFDTDVIQLLPMDPESTDLLPIRVDGQRIEVGPGLLRKGEAIAFRALLDGGSKVDLIAPLENVVIRRWYGPEIPTGVISFRYHIVSLVAVFLALAVGIVVGTTAGGVPHH